MLHFERTTPNPGPSAQVGSLRLALPLLLLALLSACNYPGVAAAHAQDDFDAATQAAATVAAQLTAIADQLQQTAVPTATLIPPTLMPTNTLPPSPTPPPTPAPTLQPTPIPVPCNWASFVADVTVPDGTRMRPEHEFKKTWRLKNIGTCSWSSDYDLVYSSGERMDGDKAVSFARTVKPGDTVELSVELTAPSDPGKYTGYWLLRDAAGRIFGIGPSAGSAFWVQIEVERPAKLAYDFTRQYCEADWRAGEGFLACPGDPEDEGGFVIRLQEPVLEGGRRENEPGLWTQPQGGSDAWITGEFPEFEVRRGDEFRAVLACLSESPKCDVRFRLEYRLGSGTVKTLQKWHEVSDGRLQHAAVDLSDLAGEKVVFILTVQAVSSSEDSAALWLMPGIWR